MVVSPTEATAPRARNLRSLAVMSIDVDICMIDSIESNSALRLNCSPSWDIYSRDAAGYRGFAADKEGGQQ